MDNRVFIMLLLTLSSTAAMSQTPQQFAYQAVVRENNNQVVANRTVGLRVSILRDSTNGQSAYTETHTPKTNTQGIVQLNIGGGTVVSGSFASVPWSSGKLFVKTEIDLQGGTNYTLSSATQLLSVPYALYSSNVSVSKSGDTVTIGTSKLIIPGSQLLPGSGTEPASLSNGLVGYWPFNGNANDESGNGNHGTVNGATLTNDRFGYANKAYYFDGVNNYIKFKSSSILNVLDNISISCWSKRMNTNTNQAQLVWFGDSQPGRDPYSIAINNTNHYYFRRDVSTGSIIKQVNSTSNSISNYTHIAGTYDTATKKMKIYINGILEDSINVDILINYSTQNMILIFGSVDDGSSQYFKGNLDEIRIYNRALTQEEITYLANN